MKRRRANESIRKVRSKMPGVCRTDGRAKYRYASDITQNTPVTARRHSRFGVRTKTPGRRRTLHSERYASLMMSEADKDAPICCRVISSSEAPEDQLWICVSRCAEAMVGKVTIAMKSLVMASTLRFLGWHVHDMTLAKQARYQAAVAPVP